MEWVSTGQGMQVVKAKYLENITFPKDMPEKNKDFFASMLAQSLQPIRRALGELVDRVGQVEETYRGHLQLQISVNNCLSKLEKDAQSRLEAQIKVNDCFHSEYQDLKKLALATTTDIKNLAKEVDGIVVGLNDYVKLPVVVQKLQSFEAAILGRLSSLSNELESYKASPGVSVSRGRQPDREGSVLSRERGRSPSPLYVPVRVPGGPDAGTVYPREMILSMVEHGLARKCEGHPGFELLSVAGASPYFETPRLPLQRLG